MEEVLRVLSGVLFVLAGVATLLNFKPLPPPDARVLLGVTLVAAGASIVAKASFKTSLAFAISLIIFILSLSKIEFVSARITKVEYDLNATSCDELNLRLVMSEANLSTGPGVLNVKGPKLPAFGCEPELCCSELRGALGSPEELYLTSIMSDVTVRIDKCLKGLYVVNQMGTVSVVYEVPAGCSGEVELTNNFGKVELRLIIPKGVKVIYDVKANLGKAFVRTPEGSAQEGSYGSGRELRVRGATNFGDLEVTVVQR